MMKSKLVRHLRAIETGVKHLFSNRLTCPYPDARQMVSERYRGMIHLNRDKCTSCMLCARACPSNAIKMHVSDGKKLPGLDYARCVFCGFCVDICPVKALEHTSLHDVAYLDYEENQFPPKKFVDGGRDPYHVPQGVVTVRIDERKGLLYGRKAEGLKKEKMMKEAPEPALKAEAKTASKEGTKI
ncbi:MAG: NuoI/complex I 23 kDa subunit family protein [Candidatus Hadarchaeaceae archaeon]